MEHTEDYNCNSNHEEYQYINLIKNILNNGYWEEGRNGKTKCIFGASMRFSLQNGKIPILTTKKIAWKTCLKELLWFIRGQTNNNILIEQDVHIWDANTEQYSRTQRNKEINNYLVSRNINIQGEGELGPIYGHQWRHFNAEWEGSQKDYTGEGVDQLQQIIDALKDPLKRSSRRQVMSAWNPCQLEQMALPPCHILCQFNVHDGNKLSCAMYQRSNDEACGTPINIASYSFLTHLLAKHCGLEAYEFVYFKGNCHIYEQHLEGLKLQVTREPFDFPTLNIKQIRENINDYTVDDFVLENYKHNEKIKFVMVP